MSRNVVIGGGSGFVGSALASLLRMKGYSVTIISRMPGPQRMSWSDLEKSGLPENTTAVVNLAGQNVLDPTRRWTPGFKQNVWSSRVNTTQSLANSITKAAKKPNVFVTISGVGIYKPSRTEEYDEESKVRSFDFLSELCHKWEAAAKLPADSGVRQTTVRSGVVLGRNGGMIKQLYLPFSLGLGGPVGSGSQFMPWIHIHDIANLLLYAIENPRVTGVVNGVAPQVAKFNEARNKTLVWKSGGKDPLPCTVVTNKEFTKAFARALWRPAFIPLPEMILKLVFSEDRAKMITEGQKVIPKRTVSYGYQYKFPDIESACKDIVRSK